MLINHGCNFHYCGDSYYSLLLYSFFLFNQNKGSKTNTTYTIIIIFLQLYDFVFFLLYSNENWWK